MRYYRVSVRQWKKVLLRKIKTSLRRRTTFQDFGFRTDFLDANFFHESLEKAQQVEDMVLLVHRQRIRHPFRARQAAKALLPDEVRQRLVVDAARALLQQRGAVGHPDGSVGSSKIALEKLR